MKLSIEFLAGENVEVSAGPANVCAGITEDGFRCLVFVREIALPEGSPDEEFADLVTTDNPAARVSREEIERLAKIAFPDGRYVAEPSPARAVVELKAIADDKSADPVLRLEAIDLMSDQVHGELPTQDFWRWVFELRRKRDETR